MLNYSTLTLINDGNNIMYSASDKKYIGVKFGPKLWIDEDHEICLRKKTAYAAATLAKAEVNISGATGATDVYRIAMYIRLRNQNNPYFSNDWTFKGKPLFVEFYGGSTAAQVVALAKKYMIAQYGYDLVKFSADGTKVVITAADQWEIFLDQDNHKGVVLEKLQNNSEYVAREAFIALADQSVVTVNNGNEAFGDFAHIVKDLRLPSGANLRWQGPAQGDIMGGEPNDDKPLPTGHYTQYTFQYDANRGIQQQTALGGLAKSRTEHIFYVEAGAVTAFEAALTALGITEGTKVGGEDVIGAVQAAITNGDITIPEP